MDLEIEASSGNRHEQGTFWITDVFDEAGSLDEMVAVVDGDAPTREADARTEHGEPDALTTVERYRSETGVVVGVHWLIGFLKRLEKRVAALEAERTPPHRPKCPRCEDPTLEVVDTRRIRSSGCRRSSST